MNNDGNEGMNIRCEGVPCVILCEMPSHEIFYISLPGPMRNSIFFFVRVGLCISCVLASNPSQATTFLVLNVNRFISSHQSNVKI
jgi:hypothetical protein